MVQYRFEVDGNRHDYADCFHNVFAENLKQAFKIWNETDGRQVKSYQVVKEIGTNFWLGSNELVIVFRDGTYHVIEAFEDYNTVFTGSIGKCLGYCADREIAYMESVVG